MAARTNLDAPTIHHHELSPKCGRYPVTPDRCMEIGLGKNTDGSFEFDCSGLVLDALAKVLGISVQDLRALRHTRQEVWALEEAGETGKPLAEADEDDVGDLIYSLSRRHGTLRTPRAFHVGILSGFDDDGGPIRLESAGNEGSVVECPPLPMHPEIEGYVYSSSTLAGLAIAHSLPAQPATVTGG